MSDPILSPEDAMAAALRPFGWTCTDEFWRRYYSDAWVFNLASDADAQLMRDRLVLREDNRGLCSTMLDYKARAERAEAREHELRDALAAMLALSILHTDECWRGMTYWREGLDCTCGLTAARDHARALVASTEPEQ